MTANGNGVATAMPRSAGAGGLVLVPVRQLVGPPVEAWFGIEPGDRVLVREGQAVIAGTALAARLREHRILKVPARSAGTEPAPGGRWTSDRRSGDASGQEGELLFARGGQWWIAAGEKGATLESPFPGTVIEARAGGGIRVRSEAAAIRGTAALAGPATGRLKIVAGADGELRAQHVDVSAAGSIIVAGARMDAEALTRARAVGVRGVVVAALGIKEQRDFLASERRGSAAVHGLPAFGALVLDGATRRPIASPLMAILEALEGSNVAIVGDPPSLVLLDGDARTLPRPRTDLVRVRSGPLVGAEGTWDGLAGPRRFPAGVTLEAGLVRLGGRAPVAVPIGDLERFA